MPARNSSTKRDFPIPGSPITSARSLPATHQQAHIIFAPDKWCLNARRRTVRASTHYRGLDCAIELDRMLNALELLRTTILDHEQARDQLMHCRGNHHRVGVRGRLHARRDVGCVAKDVGLLTAA